MTTLSIFHEVKDGEKWAKAWKKGPGSRHEMFAKYGMKTSTFRDKNNINSTGVIVEVPDMKKFEEFISSDVGQKAMAEDGVIVETVKILTEFEA